MPLVSSVRLVSRALVAVAVVAGLGSFGLRPAAAASSPADQLVSLINHDRAVAGVRALTPNSELADLARAHSQDMVDQQRLFHTLDLGSVVPSWLVVDENVGTGGS